MSFTLFDPTGDVRITAGNLPHWYQPAATYFITFRTDDSFPVAVAKRWYCDRDTWLQEHDIDPQMDDWKSKLQAVDEEIQREFHAKFSQEFMECLDKGLGECLLKQPNLAAIVARSLRHFDGQRYHLGDFVVMPNHVHVLVCLLGTTELDKLCYSWKKFTALEINQALCRKGRFWHEESFDHLVRSPEQFAHLRTYIADNPKKAGLRPGDYLHWRREEEK